MSLTKWMPKGTRDTYAPLMRSFEMADRTLSGTKVRCVIAKQPFGAPSATDHEQILFDMSHRVITNSGDMTVPVLYGLNFHELAHVLYTPRFESRMIKEVINEKLSHYFNILEDQRIETMLVAQYPSLKPWMQMLATRVFLRDREQAKRALPLLWGRHYVGNDVRQWLAKHYPEKRKVAKIQSIIDQYRVMIIDPTTEMQALKLIRAFARLFTDKTQPEHNHSDTASESQAGRPGQAKDMKSDQQQQGQAARQKAEQQEDGEPQDGIGSGEPQDGDQEPADGSGSGSGGQETDDESQDADGAADGSDGDDETDGGETDDGESDEPGDQQGGDAGETPGSNGAGSESGPEIPGTADIGDLMDAVRQFEREMMESRDVKREVARARRSLHRGDGQVAIEVGRASLNQQPVEASMRMLSNQAGSAFRQIIEDADPGYNRYKSSGKVNIARAMRGEDIETVFDQWDEGVMDTGELEIVFLVDVSSSMEHMAVPTSQALWIIKSAAESMSRHVDVTVFAFNTGHSLVYGRGQRSERANYPVLVPSGGTNPESALLDAQRIFRESRRRRQLLVMITDGSWMGPHNDNYVEQMNRAGVTTAVLMLGGALSNKHNAQYTMEHAAPQQIPLFAKGLVRMLMLRK